MSRQPCPNCADTGCNLCGGCWDGSFKSDSQKVLDKHPDAAWMSNGMGKLYFTIHVPDIHGGRILGQGATIDEAWADAARRLEQTPLPSNQEKP